MMNRYVLCLGFWYYFFSAEQKSNFRYIIGNFLAENRMQKVVEISRYFKKFKLVLYC